jgi:transcriptional regulator with XRE-family HTH domain
MTKEKLRKWREAHDLTQQELAELLLVKVQTVGSWERGMRRVPAHLFLALAELHRRLKRR